ncbi:MAG: lactonase family protein [Syntrophales bacterium]
MKHNRVRLTIAIIMLLLVFPLAASAQLIIIGNDEKVIWDDAGKVVFSAPGKDTVSIVDISKRESPRIIANLPLTNSVFGPPTNLAITPKGRLAIVANSFNNVPDGAGWKSVPDNKVYVIDLTTSPPRQIATVEVGKQPSGLDINRAGNLALVTNRADNSISVLSIEGKEVNLVDTVPMGEQVAAVAFTPDGNHALAAKFPGHKVALLEVDGQKVTYKKYDMNVGLWPYNVAVTPNGKLAISANNGNSGAADGQVDTVSIIDLEATPPRVIDHVVVGDAPEGLVISPTGKIAVAMLIGGGNSAKTSWFYKRDGSVAVLRIDGKKVTKVGEVVVGGLPEGAVFSPDGKYLYVGNFLDRDVSILKVEGTKITNTGKSLALPGRPASMRGPVQ